VLGSRKRTGIDRMMLGSVAEQVALEAPCDVLLVRGERAVAG
jgi:nucleotide-binding universal stress UspA family protein